MLVRKAKISDAESFLQMQLKLDQETKYMMYEPNERIKDTSPIENIIKSVYGDNLLLFAEEDNEIVGYISAQRGEFKRIRHCAYVVIGIRDAFQNKGIGKRLFSELENWAKANNLKRLELTVMCHNVQARRLYENFGFKIEGNKKHSMLVDGQYIDEYYMAKIM